jgi:hypothetical protein
MHWRNAGSVTAIYARSHTMSADEPARLHVPRRDDGGTLGIFRVISESSRNVHALHGTGRRPCAILLYERSRTTSAAITRRGVQNFRP